MSHFKPGEKVWTLNHDLELKEFEVVNQDPEFPNVIDVSYCGPADGLKHAEALHISVIGRTRKEAIQKSIQEEQEKMTRLQNSIAFKAGRVRHLMQMMKEEHANTNRPNGFEHGSSAGGPKQDVPNV